MSTYGEESAVFDAHLESWMEAHPRHTWLFEGRSSWACCPTGTGAYMATVNQPGGDVPFLIRRVGREEEPGPRPRAHPGRSCGTMAARPPLG